MRVELSDSGLKKIIPFHEDLLQLKVVEQKASPSCKTDEEPTTNKDILTLLSFALRLTTALVKKSEQTFNLFTWKEERELGKIIDRLESIGKKHQTIITEKNLPAINRLFNIFRDFELNDLQFTTHFGKFIDAVTYKLIKNRVNEHIRTYRKFIDVIQMVFNSTYVSTTLVTNRIPVTFSLANFEQHLLSIDHLFGEDFHISKQGYLDLYARSLKSFVTRPGFFREDKECLNTQKKFAKEFPKKLSKLDNYSKVGYWTRKKNPKKLGLSEWSYTLLAERLKLYQVATKGDKFNLLHEMLVCSVVTSICHMRLVAICDISHGGLGDILDGILQLNLDLVNCYQRASNTDIIAAVKDAGIFSSTTEPSQTNIAGLIASYI